MKQVYSALHPTEAHLVRGLLQSQGVDCEVRGETLFSARGEIPLTYETAPSVWIYDDALFSEAREIVRQYEESNNQDASVHTIINCSFCGEESENQFAVCWNCGKRL